MSYQIKYTKEAKKSLEKFKKSGSQAYRKIITLLPELQEHPRTGTGHPEPLIKGSSVTYSRHISAHHRLIYDICDDTVMVMILSLKGHYDDK